MVKPAIEACNTIESLRLRMGWSVASKVASATVHSLHRDLLRLPRDRVNLHLFVFESIIAEGAEPYVARSPIQCHLLPSELASERVNSPKQQLPQPIGRRWDCLRSL